MRFGDQPAISPSVYCLLRKIQHAVPAARCCVSCAVPNLKSQHDNRHSTVEQFKIEVNVLWHSPYCYAPHLQAPSYSTSSRVFLCHARQHTTSSVRHQRMLPFLLLVHLTYLHVTDTNTLSDETSSRCTSTCCRAAQLAAVWIPIRGSLPLVFH